MVLFGGIKAKETAEIIIDVLYLTQCVSHTYTHRHTAHTDHLILETHTLIHMHTHKDLAHIMSCIISPSVFVL